MKRVRPVRILRKKGAKKDKPKQKKLKKIEKPAKETVTEVYDPPKSLLAEYQVEKEETESEKNSKQLSRGQPLFVVHKHEASHLHYDLRLEIDGVLASWAVPKGIALGKESEKRLAILVEDHPIDYATFEGIIPEGHYGSGTVMAWDFGTFSNFRDGVDLKKSLKEGKIEVKFNGKKLNGVYALIRTNMSGNNKNWLLFRMKKGNESATADPPEISENLSAISEKTMEEISRNHEQNEPKKSEAVKGHSKKTKQTTLNF
jgi:bifunctional non-homologous end joining protein LigD